MDLKIALIGAASPQWGFTLMRDIAVVLSGDAGLAERKPVLVLEDIDELNLEKAHHLAEMRTGIGSPSCGIGWRRPTGSGSIPGFYTM